MLNSIIPEIDTSYNCWIVRSDGGSFYRHFKEHDIVAIGHIDTLNLKSIDEFDKEIAYKKLVERLMAGGRTEAQARRSAGSYIGQAKRFLSIKEKDYVITIGRKEISIGRAVGQVFIGKRDLKVSHSHNNDLDMNLSLRLAIEWEHEIEKKKLPMTLQNTLATPQTVVNLQEEKKLSIMHTIFPIFLYDKKIYFSINIDLEKDINNFDISEVFTLLNDMEFISRKGLEIDNTKSITEQFIDFKRANDMVLNVKASFMSPGEIWANIFLNEQSYVIISMFYHMLFEKEVSNFKDIMQDKEFAYLHNVIKKVIEEKKADKIQKKLKLNEPNHFI